MPRPQSPEDLAQWLRSYPDWVAELTAFGYYTVAPDGTRVQSTRAGRPVENAVVNKETLIEKVAIVDWWLSSDFERKLATYYTDNKDVKAIAVELREKEYAVKVLISKLPRLLWERHYGKTKAQACLW